MCERLVAFMSITDRASKPEVCRIIGATAGKRDNMLNLQASHNQVLRTETVSTAVLRCYAARCANSAGMTRRAISVWERRLEATFHSNGERLGLAYHPNTIAVQ